MCVSVEGLWHGTPHDGTTQRVIPLDQQCCSHTHTHTHTHSIYCRGLRVHTHWNRAYVCYTGWIPLRYPPTMSMRHFESAFFGPIFHFCGPAPANHSALRVPTPYQSQARLCYRSICACQCYALGDIRGNVL